MQGTNILVSCLLILIDASSSQIITEKPEDNVFTDEYSGQLLSWNCNPQTKNLVALEWKYQTSQAVLFYVFASGPPGNPGQDFDNPQRVEYNDSMGNGGLLITNVSRNDESDFTIRFIFNDGTNLDSDPVKLTVITDRSGIAMTGKINDDVFDTQNWPLTEALHVGEQFTLEVEPSGIRLYEPQYANISISLPGNDVPQMCESIPCTKTLTFEEDGNLTLTLHYSDLEPVVATTAIKGAAITTSEENTQTTPNTSRGTDLTDSNSTEDPGSQISDPSTWPWWAWLILALCIVVVLIIVIVPICCCCKGCPGHPDYRKERERENQRRREEEYRLRSGRPAGGQDLSGRQGSNAPTQAVFNTKSSQPQGYNGSAMGNTAPYGNSNGGSKQVFNNPGYPEPPADYPSDGVARVQVGRY